VYTRDCGAFVDVLMSVVNGESSVVFATFFLTRNRLRLCQAY